MKILTKGYRLRLSEDDYLLIQELKKYGIRPTRFIREAFREKICKELPVIIENELKRKDSIELPF